MAIDYVLATPCQPQKTVGVERLIELNRTRILARSALAHAREDGSDKPASEIIVQLSTRRPSGSTDEGGVSLQDLFDEAKPLDQVTHHCATCPAELPRELACHRRIRYPIPERVEEWLMSRMPTHLACTAGALLVRGLGEFGWDGGPVERLRSAGGYLESRVALGVRWESNDGTIEVSSDTLLQMLFFVGRTIQPTHALMLCLFLGVIPHDTSLHMLKDKAGRAKALADSYLPVEADPDIEQFAAFLRMLATGARLELPILVDG